MNFFSSRPSNGFANGKKTRSVVGKISSNWSNKFIKSSAVFSFLTDHMFNQVVNHMVIHLQRALTQLHSLLLTTYRTIFIINYFLHFITWRVTVIRHGFVVSPVMNIQHIPPQCTSKIVVEKLQVLSTNFTNLSTSCGICLLY